MQKLTRREKEIFNLLLDGAVPKEIAGKFKISYDTVVSHQKKLYRKLDVHSVEELSEKYSDKRGEINSSNGNNQQRVNGRLSQPKLLIPAGIAVLLLILILIGMLLMRENKTTDSPRTYLEDGTFFTGKTFDKIYLYANKWENEEGVFYGEQYFSFEQIFLSDIYSGAFYELMKNSDFLRLKISGEIDKECKNMNVMIHYVYKNNWYYDYQGKWYSAFAHSAGRRVSIGPGDFSETFFLRRETFETLPEGGYFIVCIFNTLLTVSNGWVDDTGDRISADMPNGTIWATIKNLKIEPLDRLAR